MEVQEILASLQRSGAVVDLVDGELRCRAPKGVLTRELVQQLQTHKPEIVRLVERVPRPPELQDSTVETYPLTFAQRRLWFLERLNGPSPTFNTFGIFKVTGPLQAEALRFSLNKVVRRHAVLTAYFDEVGGEPVQIPRPDLLVDVPLIDGATLPEGALADLVSSEGRRPFSLASDCLIRLALVRFAADRHLLLLNMHHIVADGWSLGVLVAELAALYNAELDGRAAVLPVLTQQYFDYAVAERSEQREQRASRHLEYWCKRLAEPPPALDLCMPRKRPAVQAYEGAFETFWLEADSRRRLAELCMRQQVTPFVVLLSVFKVLLARYSGQRDIIVGTITAHRPSAEVEKLIGFFANTIAVRSDLAADRSFAQLARQVQQASSEAFAHEEAPFERVVQALGIERDLSFTPVFQVLFLMQSMTAPAARLGDLSIEPVEHDNGVAKYDLTLSVTQTDDACRCGFQYRRDLFDTQTIKQFIASYRSLLEAALEHPQASIYRLPIVATLQPSSIVPATRERERAETALHAGFEARCNRAPERVALSWESGSITYAELNTRANRVAHVLLAAGATRESRVGLCLHPASDMIVGILAILKAGACYVPLDPAYPADRLAFMASDAGLGIVLTLEEHRQTLATALPAATTLIDLRVAAGRGTSRNPKLAVSGAQAAYIIYTSGSTGRPKGVVVTHANVMRLLAETDRLFDFSSDDVWTLFHSFAFDFSVWEIWGALSHGAALSIVPYAIRYDPAALLDWIEVNNVTVLSQTPSAFARLFQAVENESSRRQFALRYVVFGGESLNPAGSVRWAASAAMRGVRLINMYGITETTVHVTFFAVNPCHATLFDDIGQPLGDLSVYVLDQHLQPVPLGVRGEMFVAGPGLARGYLGRAGLTAERFVPDPFGLAGGRMYRTGDCGRVHFNGELEYLGRLDRQVNVRGFRIELGEIETVLRAHSEIRDAVVIDTHDERGEAQLIAYLVPQPDTVLDAAGLYESMRARLPSFMIPAQLKIIEHVPTTANGKVDQAALLRLDAPVQARAKHTEPRDATEAALVKLFEDTLQRQPIGVHDNFFALGGDSIISIRVIAEARRRELPVELQDLFRFQTPAALGAMLSTRQSRTAAAVSEPFVLVSEQDRKLLPAQAEDAYPLTALQAGMLFHGERDPASELYHNVSCLRLRGRIERGPFEVAVAAAVRRHPVLRTSIWRAGTGEPLQLVHREVALPLQFVDLTPLAESERNQRIDEMLTQQRRERFDTNRAPLFRLLVHHTTPDECYLTWVEHHLILDGWSVATLFTEIFEHYFAARAGGRAEQQPPQALFRDYVLAERSAAQSEADRQFWTSRVAGLDPGGLPPVAVEECKQAKVPSGSERLVLPVEVTRPLRRLAADLDVSVKSVLLAAHVHVISALTGSNDVITGLVTHGRLETDDGERVLGLFLNTVPLSMRLQRAGSWRNLIRSTSEESIAMLPHRRFPMPDMRALRSDGVLFDTAFNYMNFHVLDRLDATNEGLEVLESRNFQRNSIPLMANWRDDTSSGSLTLTLSHDPARLTAEQVRLIGGYYERTLGAMAADAEASTTQLNLLPSLHQEQIRFSNATGVVSGASQLVHARIERQAELTPDAIALRFGDAQLSYADLNARANRLAHCLIQQGMRGDGLVGVCLERSFGLLVACVAALKAGAAMVFIDPEQPPERLRAVVGNAKLDALVLNAHHREIFENAGVATIDPSAGYLNGFSVDNPGLAVHPANLAYVVFTSGTTGQPKGAMNSHAALCNQIDWMQSVYGLQADDVVLQKTPISFDVAVWELLWALCVGAQVALAQPGGHRDPPYILQALHQHAVTVCHFVPSMLRLFIDACPGRRLPSTLRFVICSGEALSEHLRQDFHAAAAEGTELYNLYGPAEASIDASYWHCRQGGGRTLIGRPVYNTDLFVVHANGQLALFGTVGELYIGGQGLGRGYLHRPDLTAERFVPHPWSDEPGARLYRTGDRVRYTSEGELEYLGRTDDQVKIGGCRIEPQEIEQALAALTGVRAAAVVVRDVSFEQKALIAYVVADSSLDIGEAQLHQALRARLPGYLCPASIVMLPAMPTGPNGKVDRRALLREHAATVMAKQSRPAQSLTELRVAEIWSRVLGGATIDLDSHFFDSGGNSLRAMQAAAAVRHELAVEVPIARLFELPTLYDFALETLRLRLQAAESEQAFMAIASLESDARIEAIYQSVTPG